MAPAVAPRGFPVMASQCRPCKTGFCVSCALKLRGSKRTMVGRIRLILFAAPLAALASRSMFIRHSPYHSRKNLFPVSPVNDHNLSDRQPCLKWSLVPLSIKSASAPSVFQVLFVKNLISGDTSPAAHSETRALTCISHHLSTASASPSPERSEEMIRPDCVALLRPPRRTARVRLRGPRSRALSDRPFRRVTRVSRDEP